MERSSWRWHPPARDALRADGVAEVMKAVRYQAKHGVRNIKVCATGGVFSFSQNAPVGAQQYSQEELDAIVREANKLGLRVLAHAHGTEGINAAIRAGVSSIEHGSILSKESIKLMKERGTYLVPQTYLTDLPLPPETPQATIDKNNYLNPLADRSIRMAYENGVKMAFGTDAGVFPHGDNAKEFASLDARAHNFLAALARSQNALALAWLDVSTGDFFIRRWPSAGAARCADTKEVAMSTLERPRDDVWSPSPPTPVSWPGPTDLDAPCNCPLTQAQCSCCRHPVLSTARTADRGRSSRGGA